MTILALVGSNHPERDGGAIIAKVKGSVWLFHTAGGSPGEALEVESFELGQERGYKAFAARLGRALGYSDDPKEAISEVGDDIGVDTEAEIQRLASSVAGRAEIVMRLGANGWWNDLDDNPSTVPYAHVERHWAVVPKTQRKFSFAGLAELLGFGATDLDTFYAAYVATALWSTNDESDDSGGDPLDDNYGPEDFAPETVKKMRSDCARFIRDNERDINDGWPKGLGAYEQAGHDFWLTRNGHGAGFWDGDWREPQAARLTKASEKFGEVGLYVGDDGKIYA